MLSGVNRAVVVLGAADTDVCNPVAHWPEGADADAYLLDAAHQALRERRPWLNGKQQAIPGEQRHDIVACPLLLNGPLTGAVAAEITSRPAKNQRAAMRVLQWGAAWLEMLMTHDTNPLEQRLLTVVDVLAKSLDQHESGAAAMAVATELTNRLGCDRVSLGFTHGDDVQIEAISQAVQIDDKTNLVRALGNTIKEALDQDASVVFPAQSENKFAVSTAHASLAREYGANAICTVPMSHDGRAIGALVLERTRDQSFDTDTVSLCEYIASLVGPILDFKRREQQSLPKKIIAAMKHWLAALLGSQARIWKTIGLVLAAAAVVIFSLSTSAYRIDAKAQLQGTVQRVVIAPFDGFLAEAPVRAGDRVRAGQLMSRLEDRELSLERTGLLGERAKLVKEHREALATHDRSRVSVLQAKLDQADAQLALVEEKLNRTRVTAPLDGIVVSGDHSQSLGAPLQRGQVLFQVAPLNSYRIILNVDEREIAAVRSRQSGQLVLAGLPNDVHRFTVERVTPISTALEGQNFFRVEARLDDSNTLLQPGMHGVAKIEAGNRRRIWIWTHGIVDWLRLSLWSWWR
jgi:RND family efflux transporter MFP subunit